MSPPRSQRSRGFPANSKSIHPTLPRAIFEYINQLLLSCSKPPKAPHHTQNKPKTPCPSARIHSAQFPAKPASFLPIKPVRDFTLLQSPSPPLSRGIRLFQRSPQRLYPPKLLKMNFPVTRCPLTEGDVSAELRVSLPDTLYIQGHGALFLRSPPTGI